MATGRKGDLLLSKHFDFIANDIYTPERLSGMLQRGWVWKGTYHLKH